MLRKYHISPFTGDPKLCKAKVKECPFGESAPHFATLEAARTYYEASGGNELLTSYRHIRKVFAAKGIFVTGKKFIRGEGSTFEAMLQDNSYRERLVLNDQNLKTIRKMVLSPDTPPQEAVLLLQKVGREVNEEIEANKKESLEKARLFYDHLKSSSFLSDKAMLEERMELRRSLIRSHQKEVLEILEKYISFDRVAFDSKELGKKKFAFSMVQDTYDEVHEQVFSLMPSKLIKESNKLKPKIDFNFASMAGGLYGSYAEATGEIKIEEKLLALSIDPAQDREWGKQLLGSTITHELFHRFAEANPRLKEVSREHLRLRTTYQQGLEKVYKRGIIKNGKKFLKDKFADLYSGRYYGERREDGALAADEVLTTGVEFLFWNRNDCLDPDEKNLKDDEHLKNFSLGCLIIFGGE